MPAGMGWQWAPHPLLLVRSVCVWLREQRVHRVGVDVNINVFGCFAVDSGTSSKDSV